MKITLTPRTLTIAAATIATIATTIGVASLVAGGDSVADHINGGAIVPASDEISGGAFVVRASAGQIDTFRRTSTSYSAEGGVWGRVPAAEGTPTPTPWLAVRVENPQGTPAPVDRLSYYNYPVSSEICTDCAEYTISHTHNVGYYAGAWFSDTNRPDMSVWVTAVPTDGVEFFSSGDLIGYGWPSWNTGGAAANIVVATQTPTPSPTPTPAPQMVAEAINPEGTRVPTWRLGQLGGEYCENCSQYTAPATRTWELDDEYGYGNNQSVIVDLDDDGDNDIVTAQLIRWNDGTGTFTTTWLYASTGYVDVGDVDDDDDLDILVAEPDTAHWLLRRGASSRYDFTEELISDAYDAVLNQCFLTDGDGDGDLDALFSQANYVGVTYWNDGGFDDSDFLPFTYTERIDVGDLDGDDDVDLFIAQNGGNLVYDFVSGPPEDPSNDYYTDTGQSLGIANTRAVALGDFNLDGDLDAFAANDGGNTVWFNNGSGTFSTDMWAVSLGSADSQWAEVADINQDGYPDVIVANSDAPDVVWINQHSGPYGGEHGLFVGGDFEIPGTDSNSRFVTAGDLNGDGAPDLVIGDYDSGEDKVFFNQLGVYIEPYANQQVLGVTPQPEICGMSACGEASDDDTEYHWYEDWGSSVRRAQFVVVTPTPTPTPDPSTGDARLRVEASYPSIIIVRSSEHGGCASCYACTELDVMVSECISGTVAGETLDALIWPTQDEEIISVAADPASGTPIEDGYSYSVDGWDVGQRTISARISGANYLNAMPEPDDMQVNPEMGDGGFAWAADPGVGGGGGGGGGGDTGGCGSQIPDEANMPNPPDLNPISMTAPTLNAFDPPTISLPMIPAITLVYTIDVPFGDDGSFNPILSSTLAIDIKIENAVLGDTGGGGGGGFWLQAATTGTVTSTSTISDAFRYADDDFISGASTNLATAENIVAAPSLSTLESREIAEGYTAYEAAAEMNDGMMEAMDNIRAIRSIGIIGPTAVSALLGLGWIGMVTMVKLLIKGIATVIDVVMLIVHLIADIL